MTVWQNQASLSAACSCPICISALHPLLQVFPGVDRKALSLLRAMLSFDPAERPTAEQALQHPYFAGLHNPAREPTTTPVSKLAFDFDRRKLTVEEVRELIYLEILEYHPSALAAYQSGEPLKLHAMLLLEQAFCALSALRLSLARC